MNVLDLMVELTGLHPNQPVYVGYKTDEGQHAALVTDFVATVDVPTKDGNKANIAIIVGNQNPGEPMVVKE